MPLRQQYNYKLRPEQGESLLGYMHRLGVHNFHSYPRWMKRDIGMHPSNTALSVEQLETLAFLSSQKVGKLASMQSPPAKDNRTTFAGWSISDTEIERGRSRLCSDCIGVNQIHKEIWNLRIVTVCATHGVKLIDACPKCGDALRWPRLDLWRCANGHELKNKASNNRRIPDRELRGVRALYEKCGFAQSPSHELAKMPEVIRNLDLSEFMAFLLFVGRAATRDKTAWRAAGAYRYDPGKTHQILQAGVNIARTWPESFITLIGDLHKKAKRKRHNIGLGPEVGRLFRMFSNRHSMPFLEVVKSAIREYVTQNQVFLQERTRRLLGFRTEEVTDFVSSAEAAELLECSKETARQLAISNNWCTGSVGAGNVLRIERSKITAWKESEAPITVTAAGRALGLWRAAVFELFQCGMFSCVLGAECDHHTGRHLVRKATVDEMLRIIEEPIAQNKRGSGTLVSWRSFRLRAVGRSLHAGVALKAMLDRRLHPRSRKQGFEGFSGLLFDLIDLTRLASSQGSGAKIAVGDGNLSVSLRDAVQVTGMHPHSLLRAIDLKLLSIRKANDSRLTRLVTLSDLHKFTSRHDTVGTLARDSGLHANAVKRALGRMEIAPVGHKKGRYSEYPLYSKADLKRAGIERALSLSSRKPNTR